MIIVFPTSKWPVNAGYSKIGRFLLITGTSRSQLSHLALCVSEAGIDDPGNWDDVWVLGGGATTELDLKISPTDLGHLFCLQSTLAYLHKTLALLKLAVIFSVGIWVFKLGWYVSNILYIYIYIYIYMYTYQTPLGDNLQWDIFCDQMGAASIDKLILCCLSTFLNDLFIICFWCMFFLFMGETIKQDDLHAMILKNRYMINIFGFSFISDIHRSGFNTQLAPAVSKFKIGKIDGVGRVSVQTFCEVCHLLYWYV